MASVNRPGVAGRMACTDAGSGPARRMPPRLRRLASCAGPAAPPDRVDFIWGGPRGGQIDSVQSFGRPRAPENRRCRTRAVPGLNEGEKRFGHLGWMFVSVAQVPTVSASLSGLSDEFPTASVRTRPTALGLWPDLNDRGPQCSASLRCDRDKTPQLPRGNSSAIININANDRRKIRTFPKKIRIFREFTKHLRDAPWYR